MIEKKKTESGIVYLDIRNASAHAKIALQGAHLFHYQQHYKEPILWLSGASLFEPGKAIRGGIPICWPWFGKHKTDSSLPQHGFARTSLWKLLETLEDNEFATELLFQLESSDESMKLWPCKFNLLLRIIVAEKLHISLTTQNCDTEPFTISSALHSYFAVSNIDQVSVEGLDRTVYFDALDKETVLQTGNILIRKEIDRIYQNVNHPLILRDQERTVHIKTEGSTSAVVWNPWIEKSRRMNDMEDDAYKTMLCIETANALNDERTLPPGEEHTLTADISCWQKDRVPLMDRNDGITTGVSRQDPIK